MGRATWHPSIIDGLGRGMVTAAAPDGSLTLFGGDVNGVHKLLPDETTSGFNAGIGKATDSSYDPGMRKISALDVLDDGTALALSGNGLTGGIFRRTSAATEWSIATETFFGNADNNRDGDSGNKIPSDDPRQAGRRLAHVGATVWVSAYRTTSPTKGIARSTDSGVNWATFRFDASREYTALFPSPQFQTAGSVVLYAASRDHLGGTNGELIVAKSADATATFHRIDNTGSGAPAGGFHGILDMAVLDEDGADVLYLVNGLDDPTTANFGVWKCVVGNPTDAGWTASTVVWTKVSTGLPATSGTVNLTTRAASDVANWWTSIAGRRVTTGGGSFGDPATTPLFDAADFHLLGDPGDGYEFGWEEPLNANDQFPIQKGRIDAILRHDNFVYIGGQYRRVVVNHPTREASTSTDVRHLTRVDATTGRLESTPWFPQLLGGTFFGRVWDLAIVDPGDGNGDRLLVAGTFTEIDATPIRRLAAIRLSNLTLDTTLLPDLGFDDQVTGVAVDGTDLYVIGKFDNVGASVRTKCAKLTLSGGVYSLDATWQPTLDSTQSAGGGQYRWGRDIAVDSTRVYIGGFYTSLNGNGAHDFLRATNKTTGATATWTDDQTVQVFGVVLDTANDRLYVAGGGENRVDAYTASTGARVWHHFSDGDTQAITLLNGKLYCGFHGDSVTPHVGDPKDNTVVRKKLFVLNATDGELSDESYDFRKTPGKTQGVTNKEGVLGVWALDGNVHLYVGGDFPRFGGNDLHKFALFQASGGGTTGETQLLIGGNGATQNTSGSFPFWNGTDFSSSQSYRATHLRSLDAGATWEAITNSTTVDMNVAGTDGEEWSQATIHHAPTNKSRMGGGNYQTQLVYYDDNTQQVYSAGKSGVWRCSDPWGTPSWQPAVAGLGGIASRGVTVDPSDSLRVYAADGDRSLWRWLDGGLNSQGISFTDDFDAETVDSIWEHDGAVLAGRREDGVLRNSDPWGVGTFAELAIVGGTQTADSRILGVCEFHDAAGNLVRLAFTSQEGLWQSIDGAAWVDVTPTAITVPLPNDDMASKRFVTVDATDRVYLLHAHAGHTTPDDGGGLWRSLDAGATWTRIWPRSFPGTGLKRAFGRIAHTTDNLLWVSFAVDSEGTNDAGLWKIANPDDGTLNTDGTTASGTIAATKINVVGQLESADIIAAIDGTGTELVACRFVTDVDGADLLTTFDGGASWESLGADTDYADLAPYPLDITKRSGRIYVSLDGSGVVAATVAPPETPLDVAVEEDVAHPFTFLKTTTLDVAVEEDIAHDMVFTLGEPPDPPIETPVDPDIVSPLHGRLTSTGRTFARLR